MSTPCPCGSKLPEAECCAPIIEGAPAPTAEALMRSRYTAYVRGAIQHVISTHDAKTRADVDADAVAAWSRETKWQGLEILGTEAGGADDNEGIVEFVARGATNGTAFAQRERSRFRKVEDRWYYVDGKTSNQPVRKAAEPNRNDPCPCGSGQKYKKCHGA
ncbi:MAG: YchJ family protein [Kofleriaceae bacterium]